MLESHKTHPYTDLKSKIPNRLRPHPNRLPTMCTLDKRGNVFVLTVTGSGDEHRLSPALIDSLRSALSQLRSQSTNSGSHHALVTTAEGKFFSNGFDLVWAESSGTDAGFYERLHHQVEHLKPLLADLLSLPMPTIAAVTGHAAAAGMMLAVSHDYVVMRKDRGVLYMSELDIGMTLPEYFMAVIGEKVGSAAARRDLVLAARKVRAEEAARMGIVDFVCGSAEETVEAAVRFGEELVGRKWNGEIYGEIRKSLFPEMCRHLGLVAKPVVASRL